MNVLLVDDHEIVRRGLKQLMAEAYPESQFGEAESVTAALGMLPRMEWDLVLLDLNLPGRSGLELMPDVLRLPRHPPVLVLSSYPEEEFAVRAFKVGAAGYVTKASVADELLTAVAKVMSGGRYVSASLAEELAAALGATQDEPHVLLSTREMEVLQLVARGQTIKAIAAGLCLSEKTIATYRARVSSKLQLSSNVELARYALLHKLID